MLIRQGVSEIQAYAYRLLPPFQRIVRGDRHRCLPYQQAAEKLATELISPEKERAPAGPYCDPAGVLIENFGTSESGLIPERVLSRARLDALRHWSHPKQRFNIRIDAEPAVMTSYEPLSGLMIASRYGSARMVAFPSAPEHWSD
jgi:hypothetical protein